MGINASKITQDNPMRFGGIPFLVPVSTVGVSQTGLLVGAITPGYAFEVERIEVFCSSITATLTVDVQIGATSVLTAPITPVAATVVAGTLVTAKTGRRGSRTATINVRYTDNASGAATNLAVRVWIRPFPLNGEAA